MKPVDITTKTIEALIEAHAALEKHKNAIEEYVNDRYIEEIMWTAENGIYAAFRNLMGIDEKDDRDEITDFVAKVFSWDAKNNEEIVNWKGAEIITQFHDIMRSFGEYKED